MLRRLRCRRGAEGSYERPSEPTIRRMLAAVNIADYVTGGETESEARQRGRNIAIALALLGMVVMFYAATIVRMGAAITGKAL